MVFDFDLVFGDSFTATWGWSIEDPVELEVMEVTWINTADGVERKKMVLGYEGFHGTWMEGVGCLDWIFFMSAYVISFSGS